MIRVLLTATLAAVLVSTSAGAAGSVAPAAVERAADRYVDAVNAGSLDRLVESFAPDGVVVDVGRRIESRDASRRWAAAEVIGGTLQVIERRPQPDGTTILVHWAPRGEHGWRADYRFAIDPASGLVREASCNSPEPAEPTEDTIAKTYFITVASSGFDRALAEAVLSRGDRAVIAFRRTDALQELIAPHPDAALAITLDVTDEAARERTVRAALDRFGHIDVLANIAGRGSLGAAEEFSPGQLREQMELNFFAAAEMTCAALPAVREQGSGDILQLTSIGGLVAFGGFGPYCASKFALEVWSEALRDEVGPLGIRVTIVEPGAFRTEFAGGKNMRPERRLDAYRPVVATIEEYLFGGNGKQLGDPAKAAQAMIAAVESDDPPLRLVLGADAIGLLERKQAAFAAELGGGGRTARPPRSTRSHEATARNRKA